MTEYNSVCMCIYRSSSPFIPPPTHTHPPPTHPHTLPTGATLKGPFSRYDYQRAPNSGPSSVRSYKTLLPASSRDVYYRDEIGNISTSHLREDEDFVELELTPR